MVKAKKEKNKKNKIDNVEHVEFGSGEVDSGDIVVLDTDRELDPNAHADKRRDVLSMRDKADEDYWALSVALSEVYEGDYYRSWGFDSWREYVEQEVDIHIRKAQFLVSLQAWFGKMTPNIRDWMKRMGWTKARMLMHVVTQENAMEWKERVEGKTVAEIEAMLKAVREEDVDGEDVDGNAEGAEHNEQSKTLTIKGMFPEMMDVWERASIHAAEVGETDKPGQMLNLICIDYLATNTAISDKSDYLRQIEKTLGIKIIALHPENDSIIFGSEYIDNVGDEEVESSRT